jgi:hypothetical protein
VVASRASCSARDGRIFRRLPSPPASQSLLAAPAAGGAEGPTATGEAVAADTGSAKGRPHRHPVPDQKQALAWGWQTLTVTLH